MSRPLVGVVGAGNVGATAAREIAVGGVADVALVDVVEGLAQGKALDMAESMAVERRSVRIMGGSDYAAIRGAAVVVVTAGIARRPGMSRDDLQATNAGIVKEVASRVREMAPGAVVIMVTNPLDVMTWLAWKVSGFPAARLVGMAGVLDSARLAHFVSLELGVSLADVTAMVLGGHGDDMVPLPGFTTVSGVPITSLLPPDAIARIVKRTRDGGAEIVSLLKQGSAFYAPGSAAATMALCVVRDEKRLMPASAVLDGAWGEKDVCLGVPVILGSGGVEKIVEFPLGEEERAALHRSAESVRKGIAALKGRGLP